MANGRRGHDSRKRGFDAVDDGHHDRRDFDRRDYHHRPHANRRYEEPSASKIRRLLVALVEKPRQDAAEETYYVASRLSAEFEDELTRETAFPTILHLALEQPFKIPFLASVILHANELNPEIATVVLKMTSLRLTHFIKLGHWRNVKLLLRFLACMQPMINDDGMLGLLGTLFSRAADLQAESPDDTFGLELVQIILLTIPYLLASAPASFHASAAELLEQTAVVASAPPAPFQDLAEPYLGEERPFPFQPLLGLLQSQLLKEAEGGWELTVVPRPYAIQKQRLAAKAADGEDTSLKPSQLHPFPTIEVPEQLNPGKTSLFPECFFSLYTGGEVESVPRPEHIASSLIRDVLVDTITILDFNRIWTAKYLIDMDLFWPANTFAPRKTQLDALKALEPGKSTWKTEDMIIDAVFSQIMRLPAPPHKLVYYHSVITEACKLEPTAIAPSLGRAIRFFYRNIPSMDRELEYRFMDWFSHHLSNFDFRWKWSEWVDDVLLPDVHPLKSFLIGGVDKEVRLSFPKRIRETLPLELYDLIPEGKDEDTPKFKFAESDVSYASEARQLLQMVKKKASDDDIQPVLDTIKEKAEHDGQDPLTAVTDVYVSCILVVGSKSLSHVLSAIERHKEFLLSVGPQSETARLQIISTVVEYWRFRPGTAVGIVDKLLNYTIVTPASVIEWALGSKNLKQGLPLSYTWLYEMVAITMLKVTTRVQQIRDAIIQSKVTLAPEAEIASLEEMYKTERQNMNELFHTIKHSLDRILSGQAEQESQASNSEQQQESMSQLSATVGASEEDSKLYIHGWATRWARVFERKSMVVNLAVSDTAVETGIMVEEMTVAENLAWKKVEREEEDEVLRRRQDNAAGGSATQDSKSLGADSQLTADLDHAPITQEFDPTNGMVCDSGPGSANSKIHEDVKDDVKDDVKADMKAE